jgi:hypothetical protein
MTRQLAAILLVVASLPITVQAPPDTTTHWPSTDQPGVRVRVAGGEGAYDILETTGGGCAGPVIAYRSRVDHTDVGAQAEYESKSGGYLLGVRGGSLDQHLGTVYQDGVPQSGSASHQRLDYWNPYVAMEKRLVGLGAGPLFSTEKFLGPGLQSKDNPWSGHFRLGWRDHVYLAAHFMEALPIEAGGAYTELGIGAGIPKYGEAWLGVGAQGPADLNTTELRGTVRLNPSFALLGGGYWGSKAGFDGKDVRASGWHIGLEWRSTAPRETTAVAPAILDTTRAAPAPRDTTGGSPAPPDTTGRRPAPPDTSRSYAATRRMIGGSP